MKKKFNLYCVLLMVALIFSITVPGLCTFGTGFIQGWTDGDNTTQKVEGVFTAVSMLPKQGPAHFTHEIYNEKTGKDENMCILTAMVNSPSQSREDHKLFSIGLPIMGVMAVGIIISYLVFFVKIILAVNRNEIFDIKMERRLTWFGALLMAYYALQWAIAISNLIMVRSVYEFHDYILAITNTPHASTLLSGIGMLLIGQIFRIARIMKEEQELTI